VGAETFALPHSYATVFLMYRIGSNGGVVHKNPIIPGGASISPPPFGPVWTGREGNKMPDTKTGENGSVCT
jgi:hypothetical protein